MIAETAINQPQRNQPAFVSPSDTEPTPFPHDYECEKIVLGSMIYNTATIPIALGILGEGESFDLPLHREIYDAISGLYAEGQVPPDGHIMEFVEISRAIKTPERLEAVGGERYIIKELTNKYLRTDKVPYYANKVLEKWQARRLSLAGYELVASIQKDMEPISKTISKHERAIANIVGSGPKQLTKTRQDSVREWIDKIDQLSKTGSGLLGVTTGYHDLDRLTGGLVPGEFVIVAGRPSMGKSSFMRGMLYGIAKETGKTVILISLEVMHGDVYSGLAAFITDINLKSIRTGRLTEHEKHRMGRASVELASLPIEINDSRSMTITKLQDIATAMYYEANGNVAAIALDYIQLLSEEGRNKSANRNNEVSDMSRGLKVLAGNLGVPVIGLSQLSRDSEKRGKKASDRRPVLSDLRDSGSLEQDADTVLFVHRDGYYSETTDPDAIAKNEPADIIVAKSRNGPRGVVQLLWMPQIASFKPMVQDHRQTTPATTPRNQRPPIRKSHRPAPMPSDDNGTDE